MLLGKLNMSEFAMADIYQHPYGTPRNPWDLTRNPGTSSSGSGAATAAFLCATSLGEDTGGSIRGPANFSGLVGLRPTFGRVSRHGVLGGSWSMDTVGPISRSVEDCAITFQAIAGHDPKDPYTWDVPVPDYRAALDGDISGLRVGVITENLDAPQLHPEFRAAVATAVGVLGELGANTGDVSIPLIPAAGATTMAIIGVEWSHLHRQTFEPHLSELDHNNKIRFLTGSSIPAQAYYKAQKVRTMLRRQILSALEEFDVLVLPSGVGAAPPVESVPGIQSKEHAGVGADRPHQLHWPVQPSRSARPLCSLRFQRRGPADGSANRGPSLRRGYRDEGGPCLRAEHRMARPPSQYLGGPITPNLVFEVAPWKR